MKTVTAKPTPPLPVDLDPTRRNLLKGLGLGAASCLLPAALRAAPEKQPNIIFMLADDLGWMDTEVYGSTYYETPNIDALASRGMRFTQAYAASPLCSPTRASILTGQYPGRLRFTTPAGHLKQEVLDPVVPEKGPQQQRVIQPQTRTRLPNEPYVTYAERLKDIGYATGFFGKWHLGRDPYLPEHQGFDTVVGGREHPGPPPKGYFAPWMCDTLPDAPEGSHICDVLTREAITFITANQGQPFLLNLWFYDVHAPFQGKEELIEYYRAKADPQNPQHCPTMGAMIHVLDQNVGRLTKALDNLGIADNTIIIFFSDNGGNMYNEVDGTTPTSNAPLRGGKATVYEGGTREPCIAVWPGVVEPGSVSDQILSSVDWYPTILAMTGLDPQTDQILDGVSLLPALKGGPFDRGPIFCHFPHSPNVPEAVGPATTVRENDWKLLRIWHDNDDGSHRHELYNLANDMGETRDLADQHPEIVRRLDALIARHISETKALCPKLNPAYAPPVRGWYTSADATVTAKEGHLIMTSTGGDPFIHTQEVPQIHGKLLCRVRLLSNSKGPAALHWGTTARRQGSFTRGRRVVWNPAHTGRWEEIDIPFTIDAPLKAFRLDPCTAPGTVTFDWIKLFDENGSVAKEWTFQ